MTNTKNEIDDYWAFGKIQPQAVEEERSILSSIMVDKNSFTICSTRLVAEDFYSESSRLIYASAQELFSKGKAIDLYTVRAELKKSGRFEEVGGTHALKEVMGAMGVSRNLSEYIEIVKDKSIRRQIIQASSLAIQKAFDIEGDSIEILNELDAISIGIKTSLDSNKEIDKDKIIYETTKEMSTPPEGGIMGMSFTDIPELNEMSNGIQGGELVIIAARPSMGKSMLANSVMTTLTKKGKKGLIWGLEMKTKENLKRFVSSYCDISFGDISKGRIDVSDLQLMDKIEKTTDIWKNDGIFFEERSGVSVLDIRSKLFALKNKHGIDYAIIDHGGLLNHNLDKSLNESSRIGLSTKLLKQTAKELDIPIILLWQLNRESETTGSKIPSLKNLRGSGNLEEDADKVFFIHRQEYYEDDGNTFTGDSIIKCDKNRNGLCGIVKCTFNPDRAGFYPEDRGFSNDNGFTEITSDQLPNAGMPKVSSDNIPF